MVPELILLDRELADDAAKSYAWTLDTHGLEMGIGRAGRYEEHAHRHFVDLIFSPAGLTISPGGPSCQLVLVEPRVRFGPVETGDFFFLKFLPSGGAHRTPDKVTGADLDEIATMPKPAQLVAPHGQSVKYFDPRSARTETLDLHLAEDVLDVRSSAGWHLRVAANRADVPRHR